MPQGSLLPLRGQRLGEETHRCIPQPPGFPVVVSCTIVSAGNTEVDTVPLKWVKCVVEGSAHVQWQVCQHLRVLRARGKDSS